MIDTSIFESLQSKIDAEATIREELQNIVQDLSKRGRSIQALLSRAHSIPADQLKPFLDDASKEISAQRADVARLAGVASQHPFYKYNNLWTRELQNLVRHTPTTVSILPLLQSRMANGSLFLFYLAKLPNLNLLQVFSIVFCRWLGGLADTQDVASHFMTLEDVGKFLSVPVNLKDQDAFHLTIEEYLQALISLVEELSRLAVNSVTLGDYARPLEISTFISDLQAGFQLLNLKNDSLRKRSDAIKYNVKKVEDVVYDLSLRNLIPKKGAQA
ncbi:hypothetical protein FQN57_001052 [Myotisia sp. PD_48]|nr:hypothetical protein FQN57_001052 [Myotisia sp. PD_48]